MPQVCYVPASMSDDVRHIFVGMSNKVWCKAKPPTGRDWKLAPLTEGEFIDGFTPNDDELCPDCRSAIVAVRGEPSA